MGVTVSNDDEVDHDVAPIKMIIKFGFHPSNWFQLSLHFVMAILIGITLRLTTFKEATAIATTQLDTDKYVLKTSFLVSFGFTKALSNLMVGFLSDANASSLWCGVGGGRRVPHAIGWGFGIVLGGLLLLMVSSTNTTIIWYTYVLANISLGAQQGWTWTTNIFMFLDILGPSNRAKASAISNSVGYLTSAFTTYAAATLSTEVSFGLVLMCSMIGCFLSSCLLEDTTHFVAQETTFLNNNEGHIEGIMNGGGMQQELVPCCKQPSKFVDEEDGEEHEEFKTTTISNKKDSLDANEIQQDQVDSGYMVGNDDDDHYPFTSSPSSSSSSSSFGNVFWNTCWYNPSAAIICWGGLTANLVTSLAWGLVLIWGKQQELTAFQLANIGSTFTFAKGIVMLLSSYISDRFQQRKIVLVSGYLIVSLGLIVTAWADDDDNNNNNNNNNDTTTTITFIYQRLCLGGIIIGTGIGSVYCVLTAALSDHTPPQNRATAIGVYKLWRDSGYAVGGLLTGWIADVSGGSFVTTTSVVAALVVVLVLSIMILYKEKDGTTRSSPSSCRNGSFEPIIEQQSP